MKSASVVFAAFFLLAADVCNADLGELMEIARAQKDAQAAYVMETKTYERVKSAAEKGAIRKGQAKRDIKNRCGEPVVSITDSTTGREKWIYKPASSSFFSGAKIYLYFDKDGNLDEIETAE